jgi:hypothetical protein
MIGLFLQALIQSLFYFTLFARRKFLLFLLKARIGMVSLTTGYRRDIYSAPADGLDLKLAES